jgi:hypothetical protein
MFSLPQAGTGDVPARQGFIILALIFLSDSAFNSASMGANPIRLAPFRMIKEC